jgi:formamidopyrimidine-DNA glycosylase
MLARISPSIVGRSFLALETLTSHAAKLLRGETSALHPGDVLTTVSQHGKIGLLCFSSMTLAVRLGMSGRLVLREPFGPHDHLALRLSGGCVLTYADHRRFGGLYVLTADEAPNRPPLADLGPDALNPGLNPALLPLGRRTIKDALLDQNIVAGLGNIYACEVLFRAGVDPRRPCSGVSPEERRRLAVEIRSVLTEAIADRGATLDDYRGTEGGAGIFNVKFAVYGRNGYPCPGCTCDGAVIRIRQAGRSTWFCPTRQN